MAVRVTKEEDGATEGSASKPSRPVAPKISTRKDQWHQRNTFALEAVAKYKGYIKT